MLLPDTEKVIVIKMNSDSDASKDHLATLLPNWMGNSPEPKTNLMCSESLQDQLSARSFQVTRARDLHFQPH